MKGEDNFFLRSSSLNAICLYIKPKKVGFTAGRCLILYALARAWSSLKLLKTHQDETHLIIFRSSNEQNSNIFLMANNGTFLKSPAMSWIK